MFLLLNNFYKINSFEWKYAIYHICLRKIMPPKMNHWLNHWTQLLMTWLSMCPADESTSPSQKVGHIAYTLAIFILNLIIFKDCPIMLAVRIFLEQSMQIRCFSLPKFYYQKMKFFELKFDSFIPKLFNFILFNYLKHFYEWATIRTFHQQHVAMCMLKRSC